LSKEPQRGNPTQSKCVTLKEKERNINQTELPIVKLKLRADDETVLCLCGNVTVDNNLVIKSICMSSSVYFIHLFQWVFA